MYVKEVHCATYVVITKFGTGVLFGNATFHHHKIVFLYELCTWLLFFSALCRELRQKKCGYMFLYLSTLWIYYLRQTSITKLLVLSFEHTTMMGKDSFDNIVAVLRIVKNPFSSKLRDGQYWEKKALVVGISIFRSSNKVQIQAKYLMKNCACACKATSIGEEWPMKVFSPFFYTCLIEKNPIKIWLHLTCSTSSVKNSVLEKAG